MPKTKPSSSWLRQTTLTPTIYFAHTPNVSLQSKRLKTLTSSTTWIKMETFSGLISLRIFPYLLWSMITKLWFLSFPGIQFQQSIWERKVKKSSELSTLNLRKGWKIATKSSLRLLNTQKKMEICTTWKVTSLKKQSSCVCL